MGYGYLGPRAHSGTVVVRRLKTRGRLRFHVDPFRSSGLVRVRESREPETPSDVQGLPGEVGVSEGVRRNSRD